MTTSTSTDGSKTTPQSDAVEQRAPAAATEPPSAELLEFLGEFSDERGEWLDPLDLEGSDAAPAAEGPTDAH